MEIMGQLIHDSIPALFVIAGFIVGVVLAKT